MIALLFLAFETPGPIIYKDSQRKNINTHVLTRSDIWVINGYLWAAA